MERAKDPALCDATDTLMKDDLDANGAALFRLD